MSTPLDPRDAAAVERFYRQHARTVLRWVVRLGGPHLDAEATAHDVFVVAMRRIGSFDPARPVEAWLFGITRRVVANARRSAWFRRVIGLDPSVPVPSEEVGADTQIDRLRRRRLVQELLDRLSADHREVIVLSDLEGRTAPEVAAMLDLSVGTVYSRLHHARKNLAKVIGQDQATLEHGALRETLRDALREDG
ncbi:MAG: RNA polymerase sigma factor [Alphaproteobacteria bacterium]|nr:RNA polymerase sigma factor [Alphaproteobacteria bacterium]MCB9699527.1 RNA polymerase sigma factor [Alphaproteobacteria bacterium]